MNDIVPDPRSVDAMLENVVPRESAGRFAAGRETARSPIRAMRQHAQLAIRRLNKLCVEQIELIRSSVQHMQRLDDLIESLSKDKSVGARRSAGRLILARERMTHTLLIDALDKNVRVIEAEGSEEPGSGQQRGVTTEQAMRILAEGAHVRVNETKTERTLEAQVG